MDISKPLHFDEHGIVRMGPMRMGFVHPSSVSHRRENPRAMSPSEFNALRASVDSLGFKSYLLAEEIKPGRYGLVDGHHRLKVLLEKKAPRIPIILLDTDDKGMIDLAMLSFNVTGSPNGAAYVDFIQDLVQQHGAMIVSEHIGIEQGLLEDMTATMDTLMAQVEAGEESGAMGNHFGGTAFVGRPIRIELVNSDETRQLLAAACKKAGVATDGQAVLVALKAFVGPLSAPPGPAAAADTEPQA